MFLLWTCSKSSTSSICWGHQDKAVALGTAQGVLRGKGTLKGLRSAQLAGAWCKHQGCGFSPEQVINVRAGLQDPCGSLPIQSILWSGIKDLILSIGYERSVSKAHIVDVSPFLTYCKTGEIVTCINKQSNYLTLNLLSTDIPCQDKYFVLTTFREECLLDLGSLCWPQVSI